MMLRTAVRKWFGGYERPGSQVVERAVGRLRMSKSDEKFCLKIAQVTRGKKLPESSKARIYAALRATTATPKWRD